MGQKLKTNAQYIFYSYIFISWKKRGAVHYIYFRSFTHITGFLMNIWWKLILIRSQIIMKLFMWSKLMKYYFFKIDTSFHQRLPNMVQRLFADAIHDAIWFMNNHEQNHPWFLAMIGIDSSQCTTKSQFTLIKILSLPLE